MMKKKKKNNKKALQLKKLTKTLYFYIDNCDFSFRGQYTIMYVEL